MWRSGGNRGQNVIGANNCGVHYRVTSAGATALPGIARWVPKVLLSLALVAYLVIKLDWSALARTFAAADPAGVLVAFIPILAIPLVASERWRCACLACGLALPHRFFAPAMYAGVFAGQFLPSGVGTDAVRLALLWRQDVPLRGGFQSIAVDRICGVSAIVVLIWVGLPFVLELLPTGTALPVALMSLATIGGGGALLLVDRLPLPARWRAGVLGRLFALIADARGALGTRHAAAALVIAVLIHLLSTTAVLLLARAFGYDLRLRDLLSVTAIAIFVTTLPISFNGWGVREAALVVGLSLLAVPREVALMVSLLFGVGGAIASLPGSVSWLRLRGQRVDPTAKSAA